MANVDHAPVALFVFNRLDTLEKVVTGLSQNDLCSSTDLYIFSDNAKYPEQQIFVNAVRRYAKKIDGFKTVSLIERSVNFGLSKSIISGVGYVLERHNSVIVLEDDIITSPAFLDYMNRALVEYKNHPSVACVSGYSYSTEHLLPEYFFLNRIECWGWATWADQWKIFEGDSTLLAKKIKSAETAKKTKIKTKKVIKVFKKKVIKNISKKNLKNKSLKSENKTENLRIPKSNELKPEIKKVKKQETEKREYKIKDYVVYPKHGVGQISEFKKINIGGIDVETYIIKFEKDKANGMVPVNKQSHLRALATINQVNKCVSILKSKPKIKRSMWSRRAQEYEAKISSGKIYELAEVVRDLNKGDDLMVDQSYSERQLFEKAYERILSEFQIILDLSLEDTQKKLDKALKRNSNTQNKPEIKEEKTETTKVPDEEPISGEVEQLND